MSAPAKPHEGFFARGGNGARPEIPPKTETPAPAPANSHQKPAKRPKSATWSYADALKEQKLVGELLKELVADPSGRHGTLQLALRHARELIAAIEALLDAEERS